MQPNQTPTDRVRLLHTIVLLAVGGVGLWLLWYFWAEIRSFTQDTAALQLFADQLGWWGPPALIAINILQMVVAPIPGYAVYLVAGLLYGFLWGGIWSSIGLLAGSMLAMWLARHFGRPLVIRMIGRKQLERWEDLIHSDSTLVWGVILLSPIGDMPYYLAGLSHVRFRKIALLSVLTRVPQAFVTTALGAGAFQLQWWQLALLTAILVAPLVLFTYYRETITCWIREKSLSADCYHPDGSGTTSI